MSEEDDRNKALNEQILSGKRRQRKQKKERNQQRSKSVWLERGQS